MSTLVFLDKYNNYFNRIIKSEGSLEEYLTGRNSQTFQHINFNPNDSVATSLIINWNNDWNPDYLLVLNDNSTAILSRWFVIESTRTRKGQYSVQLKRDSITDYQNQILDAPIFVEKATLSSNDPLILNSEGMSFNQVKSEEILLKDSTAMPWIVGYCVQDKTGYGPYKGSSRIRTAINSDTIPSWLKNQITSGDTIKYASRTDSDSDLKFRMVGMTHESWLGLNMYMDMDIDNVYNESSGYTTKMDDNYPGDIQQYLVELNWKFNFWDSGWAFQYLVDPAGATFTVTKDLQQKFMNEAPSIYIPQIIKSFRDSADSYKENLIYSARQDMGISDNGRYRDLIRYNGKIYKDGDKFYKIHVSFGQNTLYTQRYFNDSSNVRNLVINSLSRNANGNYNYGTYSMGQTTATFEIGLYATPVTVTVEEIYNGTVTLQTEELETADITVSIPSSRNHTLNEPFDMFCIPYGVIRAFTYALPEFYTNADIGILAARTLAIAGTGNESLVYDVQLLPYCPILNNMIIRNGEVPAINLSLLSEDVDYTYVKDQYNNKLGVVFWCSQNQFTFNIDQPLNMITDPNRTNAENIKISSECHLYRLSSPNYAGAFDFNIAANGGRVNFWNVDCTYKPYNPYIHVNPDFNYLYGHDYDDNRGLICNGDFSISMSSNRFAEYELNNKNYQQIFNNQIQTLLSTKDFKLQQTGIEFGRQVLWDNAFETIDAGTKGGAWAAIGTAAKVTAESAMDLGLNTWKTNRTYEIQQNYLVNNFNYTLGSIKARPNSLTKVNSFTKNYKFWPFVEIFKATETEENMLLNKIRYDGMTVMRIGKISEFLQPERTYIKGQVIRLEGISDDTHILNDIYTEIIKGVYL